MEPNRSMPASGLIPVIGYPDALAAADWICSAFGFAVRLRIGDHRVQLERDGAWMVAKTVDTVPGAADRSALMLRVGDADRVAAAASALGARIVEAPADRVYGERQCSLVDPWGIAWTLSQTIADVAPEDWLKPE